MQAPDADPRHGSDKDGVMETASMAWLPTVAGGGLRWPLVGNAVLRLAYGGVMQVNGDVCDGFRSCRFSLDLNISRIVKRFRAELRLKSLICWSSFRACFWSSSLIRSLSSFLYQSELLRALVPCFAIATNTSSGFVLSPTQLVRCSAFGGRWGYHSSSSFIAISLSSSSDRCSSSPVNLIRRLIVTFVFRLSPLLPGRGRAGWCRGSNSFQFGYFAGNLFNAGLPKFDFALRPINDALVIPFPATTFITEARVTLSSLANICV